MFVIAPAIVGFVLSIVNVSPVKFPALSYQVSICVVSPVIVIVVPVENIPLYWNHDRFASLHVTVTPVL